MWLLFQAGAMKRLMKEEPTSVPGRDFRERLQADADVVTVKGSEEDGRPRRTDGALLLLIREVESQCRERGFSFCTELSEEVATGGMPFQGSMRPMETTPDLESQARGKLW